MKALFILNSTVQHGKHRGKRLGFPTINASASEQTPEGIYVSLTQAKGKQYKSLTFIGTAKTYDETEYLAETYLFDFADDLYGETVTIAVLHKLRENQKFETEEALIAQMEEDKREAEDFFNKVISSSV